VDSSFQKKNQRIISLQRRYRDDDFPRFCTLRDKPVTPTNTLLGEAAGCASIL
jgi:hypothetical protein